MTSEEEVEVKKSKKVLLACKTFFNTYVPITSWLPQYKWKEYFVGDLMAGMTMACLHIAQGIAFAIVAKVEPIMGLYTSCISVFVYCIFGTAPISSFGTVSVTSLLVGNSINNVSGSEFTFEELAEVMTFLVGALYILFFFIRYHVIIKLFTKHMTSAFVLACAVQVVVKSSKFILGVHLEESQHLFSFIYFVYYISLEIPKTNFITLGLSVCILIVLFINTYVIIPQMKKVTKIIIPVELILMITVTLISYFIQLEIYAVELLGEVPTGFTAATLPRFEATTLVWSESLIIGSVNLAITLTMVLMFNPDVKVNQEMLALGISNVVCSNFHTIPFGNSMMRTALAQSCGIKTLLAQIISAFFVLLAILFMGPLLSPLPMCALGCIVVYGLLMLIIAKSKELPLLFKGGAENIIIWVLTGLVTLFISIELGLLTGLVLTLRQYLANPNWNSKKEAEVVETDKNVSPPATDKTQQKQPRGK